MLYCRIKKTRIVTGLLSELGQTFDLSDFQFGKSSSEIDRAHMVSSGRTAWNLPTIFVYFALFCVYCRRLLAHRF